MGSSEPDVPAYQGGITKIGDRTVSSNYKEGNNIVNQYNPTSQEQSSFDYLQSVLPNLYQNATTVDNMDNYVNNYTQNQKNQLEKDYVRNVNTLKGALTSSGKIKDSAGLEKFSPLNESYYSSLEDINANAPVLAQQLQSGQQSLNTNALSNAMNGLNNYYNNAITFGDSSNVLSNMGNKYAQWAYQQELAQAQREAANQMALIKAGVTAAGLGLANSTL